MSFWRDENNEVHESDTGFNKIVVETIGIAKNASSVSECINTLANGRTVEEVRAEKDKARVDARKKWAEEEEIGQER